VEHDLRTAVLEIFMFVFTQVRKRTHVDTAQNDSDMVNNSHYIC